MNTAVVSKPYYDEEGFDTYILDDERGLYAIFDGMGISTGARAAARGLKQTFEMVGAKNEQDIATTILGCVDAMRQNRLEGGTTAVVVFVDASGRLHYASVGDSRLYIVSQGEVRQVTTDEGEGNLLNNYVGYGNKGVNQLGVIEDWDKFMICSDGITGDWPEQFIDAEVENILKGHELPAILCQRLLVASKKPDDKTVIVGIRDGNS